MSGLDDPRAVGYAELDRGRTPKAAALFKRAIASDPSHAEALFPLGETYREEQRAEPAVDAFLRHALAVVETWPRS